MAPLPPLPADNTPRYWVKYTSYGKTHEIMFRAGHTATEEEMNTMAHSICTGLSGLMRANDSFYAARYSAQGSPNSFPSSWNPIPGAGSNDPIQGDYQSFYVDYVGRDTADGRKVKWTFFTASNSVVFVDNNRIFKGQNPSIDATIQAFVDQTGGATPGANLATISAADPIVYNYVNTGFNSYWQRKQRR